MNMKQQRQLARQRRREKRARILKKQFTLGVLFTLVLELIIVTIAPYAVRAYRVYFPEREDGHITRKLSEVMPYLPEEPEDIESEPYKAQIPEIIQRDIDKMLASKEELSIVYESENSLSKLIIEKDEYEEIQIRCEDIRDFSPRDIRICNDISFYKTEDGISVYGRSSKLSRRVCYCKVRENRISSSPLFNKSIDCFGVSELKNESYMMEDGYCMWEQNSFLTLIRQGNEFKFYDMGQQYGETITFPGADIETCAYHYILDANHDMYYMYYCTDKRAPWVHFVKVAENIDHVEGSLFKTSKEANNELSLRYDPEAIEYYTYIKNGKRYVDILDAETEKTYGAYYGEKHDDANAIEPNYSIQTVEISEDNIREIKLFKDEGSYFNVYAIYVYGKDTDLYIYEIYRVRGLDNFLSENIPEAEINSLLGTVKPEEYEAAVQAIKDLYQKYE